MPVVYLVSAYNKSVAIKKSFKKIYKKLKSLYNANMHMNDEKKAVLARNYSQNGKQMLSSIA